MNHHEQHHHRHEKEREHQKHERARSKGRRLPIHPTKLVIIGMILVLMAILVWTFVIW